MLSRVFPGIHEGRLVVVASALFSAILSGAVLYAVLVVVAGLLPILETRSRPARRSTGCPRIPTRRPSQRELGRAPRRAIRSRSFVLYTIAMAGMGFSTTAVVVLQIPFLESRGMSATVAAAIGFGGAVPVRPALVADYCGTRWFGTVFGITMSIRTFAAAPRAARRRRARRSDRRRLSEPVEA